MGDLNRAASFAKNFQKHAGRARELLRQNIGKADKTTDEDFEEYVKNFTRQQVQAVRFAKEVRNYQTCVRALQAASKSLSDVVCESYEPNWIEHDKVQVQTDMLEKKWEDFSNVVNDLVIKPLVAYSELFPDVHNKILKRRRKLLDYDDCRHTVQSLEQQNAKKREEAKIAKAKEQLSEKHALYESINTELREELPALYDSRISFLASNMQCLFTAEATFHTETSKIFTVLNDAVEALATENQKGAYSIVKQGENNVHAVSNNGSDQGKSSGESLSFSVDKSSSNENLSPVAFESSDHKINAANAENADESAQTLRLNDLDQVNSSVTTHIIENSEVKPDVKLPNESSVSKVDLPSGVLYQVKATYQYAAEDGDELSFECGDIINVIEFDDPEQQEEGWLMGYKEHGDMKGLFPANFTKPT